MKVVTAAEMQRIDTLPSGESMDKAAAGIARVVEEFVYANNLPKRILLLTGKGNNGGDAYTAGSLLLAKGFFVKAIMPFPVQECAPLCKERHDQFVKLGGKTEPLSKGELSGCALILDGLVGTGFKGKAEGALADAINWGNKAGIPIFAIDIPSGLNGTTGEVGSVVIQATATIFIGLPKIGFFIGKGWDCVGKLIHVDFGLSTKEAKEEAILLEKKGLTLPKIRRSRHKYETGYVLAIAGSQHMPGAAALATAAALRSGAGIVRLFSNGATHLLDEVIREELNLTRIQEESKRAASYLIGPGLGRTPDVEKFLKELLPALSHPAVLDADALYFLAKNPSWKIPPNTLLTPHHGEMEHLLTKAPTLPACQEYAEHHQTTLILKGGPTFIFHPGKKPLIVTAGDPCMATAGTGDVLTGILAGLLAQKMAPYEAAALGVYLHGIAGELAASDLTSHCMIASDLLDYLPAAFGTIQS